jgi:hypothetical protein
MLSKTTEQFAQLSPSLQYLQTEVSEEAEAFSQKSLLLLQGKDSVISELMNLRWVGDLSLSHFFGIMCAIPVCSACA